MTEPVNGNSNGNLLKGGVEFAHSDSELTQDELKLLRGLFAQRSDRKAARALAVLNALDKDSGLITYLGNELGLLQEGLNVLIHQERNRANRLRNYDGVEKAAPAVAVSQAQVKAKKKDWGIKLMDATSFLMIGLVVLAAALLFAVYSWYVEHRRFTRLNRAATRRRAASKFGRAYRQIKRQQEQGRGGEKDA